MHSNFPRALVECLGSGALPSREQLGTVALRVWQDWCRAYGFRCLPMPSDPAITSYLNRVAWVALTGEPVSTSPLRPTYCLRQGDDRMLDMVN